MYKISKDSMKELRTALRNFNAKIKRLQTVDKEIDIPEKETIKAIKERVTNKWELNREIDKLQRFTQRNAEELVQNKAGVVLSRWEFENLQREQRRLSSRLLRDIQRYGRIKPTEFGEEQVASYSQMGDDKLSNLKARRTAIANKKLSKITMDQLKRLKSLIKATNINYRSTKKELFYNNYLDGTLFNLAYVIGFDSKKIEYIKSKLNELSPDQFVKAFNSELALRYLQDKYVSKEEQLYESDLKQLTEDVTPILEELYNSIDKIVDTYK